MDLSVSVHQKVAGTWLTTSTASLTTGLGARQASLPA